MLNKFIAEVAEDGEVARLQIDLMIEEVLDKEIEVVGITEIEEMAAQGVIKIDEIAMIRTDLRTW